LLLRALVAEAADIAARRGLDEAALLRLDDLDIREQPRTDEEARELVYAQADFYNTLVRFSGSGRMLQRTMWALNDFGRLLYFMHGSGFRLRPPTGQPAVVKALAAGDPDAARAAVRRLLDDWEKLIVNALLDSDVLQGMNLAGRPSDDAPANPPNGAPAKRAKKKATARKR
jgi:DNA-binding GntR family transcriptional regulator